MHVLFSDGFTTGKTIGEFPLIYYMVGLLWKVFGPHEFIYRLLLVLVSFTGLYYLYRLSWRITGSWFWSVTTPLLLFTSPVFASYSNNFLTNAPAFSIMLVAWYFFYCYYHTRSSRHFVVSLLLFLLAGLLKISTLMSFCLLGPLLLAEWAGVRLVPRKMFTRPWLQGGALVAVLLLVAAWYLYAEHFLRLHCGRYTFTSPVPAWDAPAEGLKAAWRRFTEHVIAQIHQPNVLLYVVTALVFLLTRARRMPLLWVAGVPALGALYVLYVTLFYYSMDGHDYYHIEFLAVLAAVHLGFIHYLTHHEQPLALSAVCRTFAGVFFLYNIAACSSNLTMRYHGCPPAEIAYRQLFAAKKDIELLDYIYWRTEVNRNYFSLGGKLDSAGIPRTARLIMLDDPTFNNFLYLAGRKGWTQCVLSDSAAIALRISLGAGYLVASEETTLGLHWVSPFLDHPLFTYGNIRVFDLRPYRDR
jgi:hypothetical protein